MSVREQLHRPSDASPQLAPVVVDRRRTVNDAGDPADSGTGGIGNRSSSELAYTLGGGAVLLVLAFLLYALATRLGTGLTVSGEQFAGLFLAGVLGTFIARKFAVKPR